MRRALITGITGQDGSYLSELLLEKGYEVHGLVRRETMRSGQGLWRIAHILDRVRLHGVSYQDHEELHGLVAQIRPHECYHLAGTSIATPTLETACNVLNSNINSTLFMLEAISALKEPCRFYFAATSEMFGDTDHTPQNESASFCPRSPYGISKVASYQLVRNYRKLAGMFSCSGILYNHESPRRGEYFVTKKIVRTAVRIKLGLDTELRLGNLEARRDWGFAGDYVRAMWLMLQQDSPRDYVIATNKTHRVLDFVEKCFSMLGLDWRKHTVVDEKYYRPCEKFELRGDYSRASQELGWEPTVSFEELVEMMVSAELSSQTCANTDIRDAAAR